MDMSYRILSSRIEFQEIYMQRLSFQKKYKSIIVFPEEIFTIPRIYQYNRTFFINSFIYMNSNSNQFEKFEFDGNTEELENLIYSNQIYIKCAQWGFNTYSVVYTNISFGELYFKEKKHSSSADLSCYSAVLPFA